jgi:hypothetical protein
MTRMRRAVRMEVVYLALAACVATSPLSAQRIADLAAGPVVRSERIPVGDGDSTRTSDASVVQGGVISGILRSGDESAPLAGVRLRAPARRCEAVFPFVAYGVLVTLGVAAFVQVLPGSRPFRDAFLPVAVIAVAAIGVAAVVCNR